MIVPVNFISDTNIPMQDMEAAEIGSILRHPAMGRHVLECVRGFPSLNLEAQLQPITRLALHAFHCVSWQAEDPSLGQKAWHN